MNMEKESVFSATREARNAVSHRRGWRVSTDSPVCIFVATELAKRIPGAQMVKIDIPERDDFQAVIIAEVEGELSLIDPVHLVWLSERPEQEPPSDFATLILPIRRDLDIREAIPYWNNLIPEYLNAVEGYIHSVAAMLDA